MQEQLIQKYSKLKEILKNYRKFILAFSGGVDSQFILHTANEIDQCQVIAVTVNSELHSEDEIENAKSVCKKLEIPHQILKLSVLKNNKIKLNLPKRCYWCKLYIFEQIIRYAQEHKIETVVDGTNSDDLHVYRPGRKALKELKIESPLMQAGLTKEDIRKLAKEKGYHFYNLPSKPCLATRFPYHTELTEDLINQIKSGEKLIAKLFNTNHFRLRFHDKIARLEIPTENFELFLNQNLRKNLIDGLKKIGFSYVVLDLEGLRSGSMDIDKRNRLTHYNKFKN